MPRIPLPEAIDRLQAHYGEPSPPAPKGPWEMILWENIAYLADDERRREALQALQKQIGAGLSLRSTVIVTLARSAP
jgi:hypothetical protein